MEYHKRKFMRFDIPLNIEFKPTKEATEYSWGVTRNFSYEGLSLESENFDLKPKENLELRLKFPQSDMFVFLLGDVVWKRQSGRQCLAGIKLREIDKETKSEILEKISAYGKLPIEGILYDKDLKRVIRKMSEEKSASKFTTIQKNVNKSSKKTGCAGIIKQYLKTSPKCRVTFRLPKEAAQEAQIVTIVGDFNNWSLTETPMKRLETGDFTLTLELPCNREYRFRYLIDGNRWENDWCADKYVPNAFGSDDSLVIV
jgi:hypothetical protein